MTKQFILPVEGSIPFRPIRWTFVAEWLKPLVRLCIVMPFFDHWICSDSWGFKTSSELKHCCAIFSEASFILPREARDYAWLCHLFGSWIFSLTWGFQTSSELMNGYAIFSEASFILPREVLKLLGRLCMITPSFLRLNLLCLQRL